MGAGLGRLTSSCGAANGTACVEVAHLAPTRRVGVHDSRDQAGPALVVPVAAPIVSGCCR
ncbi:DUF397 domain-containing protein [Streptomyces sp. NPDC059134]|uniref:DUF397 domain-containing protein n=1 Tax=Streptomyces sp. NPDC059134 TaxID=3346738 RepID=UPI00368901DC